MSVLKTMQVGRRLPDIIRDGLATVISRNNSSDGNTLHPVPHKDECSSTPMSMSEFITGAQPKPSSPDTLPSLDTDLVERASRIKEREEEVRGDLAKIIAEKVVEPTDTQPLPEWLAKQNERIRIREEKGELRSKERVT